MKILLNFIDNMSSAPWRIDNQTCWWSYISKIWAFFVHRSYTRNYASVLKLLGFISSTFKPKALLEACFLHAIDEQKHANSPPKWYVLWGKLNALAVKNGFCHKINSYLHPSELSFFPRLKVYKCRFKALKWGKNRTNGE